MLVLARKTNEAIQIGPNITITVLRVKGKTVKLGIEAPETVPVVRKELLLRPADSPEGQGPPGASSDSADATRSEKQPANGESPGGQPRTARRKGGPEMVGPLARGNGAWLRAAERHYPAVAPW